VKRKWRLPGLVGNIDPSPNDKSTSGRVKLNPTPNNKNNKVIIIISMV
jgi:hypothetical protein